ncbi:hypothetical protein FBT96_10230 [Rhodobacter capsulatus]|jgi:hypothetical protein|uniref:Uncharacterized protein n=1 Tax=Rhodobacter capsulatus TaxID=1061 RepID=A0A4U1JQG9_RHOCA|nr:hypothetical protein [Rhodobacter capsulatus]TKD18354.1 hypothetical protein FBT96_10230 [Rhodobacter capsulatus]
MSNPDTFEILAEEIGVIRRQIETLQRTSLNKDEAEAFNKTITDFLGKLTHVPQNLQKAMQRDLAQTALDVRAFAVEAAQSAAIEAIEKSHAESLKAAKDLSRAAGEARREAWRYFGGFWVWLASIGAAGALVGALAVFWLQGRADAKAFGQYPGIYCPTAGGQVVTNAEGRRFCAFWIDQPPQTGN